MPVFLRRIFGSTVALKKYNFATKLNVRLGLYMIVILSCVYANQFIVQEHEKDESQLIVVHQEEQKAQVLSSSANKKDSDSISDSDIDLEQHLSNELEINREGSYENRPLTSRSGNNPVHKEPASVTSQQEKQLETISVVATGYTAGVESTGKSPDHPSYGITKSGIKVHRDANTISTVAADPKIFPIGTLLYIPEYGYGIVADTGSAIKGNKIDLYYDTVDDVYNQWGKKEVEVYVIEQGDGKLSQEVFNELKQQVESGLITNPTME